MKTIKVRDLFETIQICDKVYSGVYELSGGYITFGTPTCGGYTEKIPTYSMYLVVPVSTLLEDEIVGYYIKGFDELPDVDEYLRSLNSWVLPEMDRMMFDEAKLFDVRAEKSRLCAYPYLGLAFNYNEYGQPYMYFSIYS